MPQTGMKLYNGFVKIAARISHFLIPQESNNQKARVLHNLPLSLIAVFILVFQVFLQNLPRLGIILGYAANIKPEVVIELTNQKRQEVGLPPLRLDPILSSAALQKGADMSARDYWAHVAPDGTEPWKFFRDAGYEYRFAGENLARDFANAQTAVSAWMASSTHRENILSSRYQDIGVAVIDGDIGGVQTTLVVQFFGTRLASGGIIPVAQAQTKTEVKTPLTATQPTPAPTWALAPDSSKTQVLKKAPEAQVLVSPLTVTKNTSITIAGFLVIVLGLDILLVYRRRIVRIGGRSLAHLSFLVVVILGILVIKSGAIL